MPRSPGPASGGIVWGWCRLWRWTGGDTDQRGLLAYPSSGRARDSLGPVHRPQKRQERDAVALCIARGRPTKTGWEA